MKDRITENKIIISANIFVEPDNDSFYATCPAFKGIHTCGATEQEAIENVRNAIVAYVVSLIKHGEPIPCCTVIEKKKFRAMSRPPIKTFQENIPIPA